MMYGIAVVYPSVPIGVSDHHPTFRDIPGASAPQGCEKASKLTVGTVPWYCLNWYKLVVIVPDKP